MSSNDQVLPYYIDLQNRLHDVFLYVTCHEQNFDTYSIKIESLLVDTCSFFDSLCQDTIRNLSRAGFVFAKQNDVCSGKKPDFRAKASGKINFRMDDYRILLENEFCLSKYEVGLNTYDGMRVYDVNSFLGEKQDTYLIRPFAEWSSRNYSLGWWKAFTNLKHNRLSHHQDAKLRHVLYALAATFIIVSRTQNWQRVRAFDNFFDLFFPWYASDGCNTVIDVWRP